MRFHSLITLLNKHQMTEEIKMNEEILVPTFFITGPLTPEQTEHRRRVGKQLSDAALKDWVEDLRWFDRLETFEYKSIDQISKEQ